MRFFNTAGPVNCDDHYCLPPLTRFDLSEITTLIGQKKYFILHAPRQTGKTSCMLALMDHLNKGDQYACLYMNVEGAQAAREDIRQGMNVMLRELASRAKSHLEDGFPESIMLEVLDGEGYGAALNQCLTRWTAALDRPLVLLMDEIDSLIGDTLISVLRQIRSGYDRRPSEFPQSIVLCGVRDVRDYRIHSSGRKEIITGGSAFNIKAKSLRIGDFSFQEMEQLYQCHTAETGQIFTSEAMDEAWRLTEGQPWLVNALAYETCFEMTENRDRSIPVTAPMIETAKENLILRRETHIDQLADKLKEKRVQSVIEPLITGTPHAADLREDDLQYVTDLGLVKRKPQVRVSNPIYLEIIPRMLTSPTQDTLPYQTAWYVAENGRLDMDKLLSDFQQFVRDNSEHWVERFQYKEAGPQLLLQAFLQRVVNSGGRVEREYGLGRMRTDLLVIWPTPGGVQRAVIELKVKHKSLEKTIEAGLPQTADYMDRCAAEEGHLVIFDRDAGRTWEEKIFVKTHPFEGKEIRVWGM